MVSTETDIGLLFKRLEILQNLISLQDTDDIEYQAIKIEKANSSIAEAGIAAEVDHILLKLKKKEYGYAMQLINELIQERNTLVKWIDPEIQGLLAEVKAKSALITNLEEELADLEKTIHDFELRHTQELGYLILNMLALKSRIAYKAAAGHPESVGFEREYRRAIEEEEEYKGSYKHTLESPAHNLSREQMEELKNLFKKISKLTHPDLVDQKFAAEATALFIKAKQARDKNDLAVIMEIWEYLAHGKPFILKEETLNDREELRAETKRLYFLAEQLFHKIRTIKTSDAYQTIAHISDWDIYFSGIKEQLNIELNYLKSICNE